MKSRYKEVAEVCGGFKPRDRSSILGVSIDLVCLTSTLVDKVEVEIYLAGANCLTNTLPNNKKRISESDYSEFIYNGYLQLVPSKEDLPYTSFVVFLDIGNTLICRHVIHISDSNEKNKRFEVKYTNAIRSTRNTLLI